MRNASRASSLLPALLLLFATTTTFHSSKLAAQEAKPAVEEAPQATVPFADYIEQTRLAWQVPGMAVAIVKDGQVVISQGFGVRELGKTEPVDGDTLFAIASNSKAFTAASLAILVDEGKVSWDDLVTDYLPWFRLRDPLTRDMRVRDLLCHRSGLGTFSGDLVWWGTNYSPKEVLQRAAELKPAAPFRARYGYTNLMFLAAGLVIEEASGQAWSEFVQSRLLLPVGMNRTVTSVKDLLAKGNFATPHKTLLSSSKPLEWMDWDNMAAAGGIISSSNDMSRWLKTQLNRGKLISEDGTTRELFSSKQSDAMWENHTPIPVSSSYRRNIPSANYRGYGLGWSLSDYKGRKVVSHGGGYDGMYSQVLLVPQENLGIVVLTNSMTGISSAISHHVMDHYLGGESRNWSEQKLRGFLSSRRAFQSRIDAAIQPVITGTSPSHSLESYTGAYECSFYGGAVVELENNGLVLKLLPNKELVADLRHLHYDTFSIHWRKEFAWFAEGTANFISNAQGKVNKIELDVPNDDMWFYELDLQRKP